MPFCEITTARALYRLRGTLFDAGVVDRSPTILVTVERLGAKPPSAEQLATRYRLTPAETQVALLLIQRRTNEEVASALGISAHTTRHHTESVFRKIGARTRRQAAEILSRLRITGCGSVPSPNPPEQRPECRETASG